MILYWSCTVEVAVSALAQLDPMSKPTRQAAAYGTERRLVSIRSFYIAVMYVSLPTSTYPALLYQTWGINVNAMDTAKC